MGGKPIDWDQIAKDRGYDDPVQLVIDIHEKLGSKAATAIDLGVSVYPVYKILKEKAAGIMRECRHCKGPFKYSPQKHNQRVCDNPKCQEIEAERRRLHKIELTKKARKERYNAHKKETKTEKSDRECPECKKPMEKYNRIKCKACWGAMRANGPNMIDAYGECAVQYG